MIRKKRKMAVIALSVGLCFSAGAAVALECGTAGVYTSAERAELSEPVEVERAYLVGSSFTVPASGIRYNGKVYPANAILYFPDGSARAIGTVSLSEIGKYVLEYSAVTEDGAVSVTKEFFAAQKLAEVSGNKSQTAYGSVENAEARTGLVTELAQGDKLVINKSVDLTGKTKDDVIASVFVAPKRQGVADALNLVFTLTDANDSENVVTVTAKRLDRNPLNAAWSEKNAYVTANAADQPPTGLEASGSGSFSWNGNSYILHRNDIYGAGVLFSMAGIPYVNNDCTDIGKPEDIAAQSLSLSFDYEEKRIYVNGAIVADLDDASVFPASQWKGFETGECYLTVHATSYNAESFRFVTTEFDGLKGDELAADFVIDTEKPEIEIVYGDYTETGFPDAVVGLPYRVPQAIGFDRFDKGVEVTARVYLDYATSAKTDVQVTDGAFTPQKKGEYTVIYTAKDRFGNETELLYSVNAVVSDAVFSLTLDDAPESGETGKVLSVAVPHTENGRGITRVSIAAKHAASGTEVQIDSEAEGYAFRPLYAGSWEIVYDYSDYLESKTHSYTVTVAASETPYLYEDAALPKYLIRGAAYPLPALKGYAFATGEPVEQLADVFVQDDGGAERPLAGKKFISYANRTATLIYRLGGTENGAEKRYEIPVTDVGYDGTGIRIQDYFAGEHFASEAGSDRISLTTQETGTQSFEFINAVQVFDFRTLFYVGAEANRFSKINVYLTDSVNAEIAVKVSYARLRMGSTNATVNDGETVYTVLADFTGTGSDNFRLAYHDATKTVSPSTDYNVPVETDLSGKPFNGFPSGKAYVRFELEGITGSAGLELLQLNNQPLSKIAYDLLRPEISGNAPRGEKYMGDKVAISATVAADVLDPDLKFTMSVKAPDGSFAVADDGTVLDSSAAPDRDYTITANQYGSYVVEYVSEDTSENKTVYSYIFTVYDTQPPVITLGEGATSAKVGDTVVIKQATVTDNYTACKLLSYVKLPDGTFRVLPGNSFVATRAGEYTVFYMANDEDGNSVTVSYAIVVE